MAAKTALRVVGYARYSTQKQDKGLSVEAQEKEIRDLCAKRGWEFTLLYADPHVSGATPIMERAALAELMAQAKKRSFDTVVAFDVTRIARDQGIFWEVVTMLKEAHVTFTTVILPDWDSNSPEFQLLAGTLQGAGSYERLLLARKVKITMRILRASGKKFGRPPAGFEPTAEKGKYRLSGIGKKAWGLYQQNEKISAAILAKELKIEYKRAWNILASIVEHKAELAALGQKEARTPTPPAPEVASK